MIIWASLAGCVKVFVHKENVYKENTLVRGTIKQSKHIAFSICILVVSGGYYDFAP